MVRMARKRDGLEQFRRTLYFTQRDIGDYQALKRGVLPKRLLRRSLTRRLFQTPR